MDVDGADAPAKLSKADKKKQKKQKGEDGKAVEDKVAPTPEKKDKKEKASKGETKELPSGLRITDSKVGTGPQAKKGQRIEMRYIGKLQNGKIFDQNTKGKPVRSVVHCSRKIMCADACDTIVCIPSG